MPLHLDPAQVEATRAATAHLRQTLTTLSTDASFALGQQDSTAYGVGWREDPDRSDIKSVCGSHPAVYGWDLFRLELGARENGDQVKFELMRQRIQEAYGRGGIITISWHADNPVSGGDAWDRSRAVAAILPGGSHHAVYRVYLDRVADFLGSLRGDQQELIPVIFRPFHEHNGSWFWWGASRTTDADYIALWQFTVRHLTRVRGLDQLLFAFSPGAGSVFSEKDYLFRYPGDDFVDVFGLDDYYGHDAGGLVRSLEIVTQLAAARHKIPALTEVGVKDGLRHDGAGQEHWFTRSFLAPIQQSPTASRIAYALFWRNADTEHFFVPFVGHPSAADFRAVCDDPRVLLQADLPLR